VRAGVGPLPSSEGAVAEEIRRVARRREARTRAARGRLRAITHRTKECRCAERTSAGDEMKEAERWRSRWRRWRRRWRWEK
jgi:hypothetical protein